MQLRVHCVIGFKMLGSTVIHVLYFVLVMEIEGLKLISVYMYFITNMKHCISNIALTLVSDLEIYIYTASKVKYHLNICRNIVKKFY